MGFVIFLIEAAIFVAIFAGGWKAFVKAGLPGWAFIVPIYNLYLMWKMTDKPILWFILAVVPCTSIVGMIVLGIDIAKAYGKGTGMGVAIGFGVGWPFIGFGDAVYSGKRVDTGLAAPPAV